MRIGDESYLKQMIQDTAKSKKKTRAEFLGESANTGVKFKSENIMLLSPIAAPKVIMEKPKNLRSTRGDVRKGADFNKVDFLGANKKYSSQSLENLIEFKPHTHFQPAIFPNFSYDFSSQEIENTDWYKLVHKKKLRRAMVPASLLKQ